MNRANILSPLLLFIGYLLMTLSSLPANTSASTREGERLLTDFTAGTSDFGWYVVNDNVMGGRSDGGFELEPEQLLFTGTTNTDGGGFSSIRTAPMQLDLSSQAGIRLVVKGDGRRYTWRLTSDARWRGRLISYWADFETRNGEWTTANLPFSSFIPRSRGYQLDGPALDAGQITGMGLMIYDKQDGPFHLQLANVSAYSKEK
ncbi:MAG: CIA30 family protein [Gammaproteobacteria bacterium]|nr:CIA30 family protein [Gammaproteobacteria bacterium]NNF61532.1 CIA30 family protein [Gammaproteobacteria bacterium]NNM19916.1 CIA30 family protein [Gammaproteobacteria bacterium]